MLVLSSCYQMISPDSGTLSLNATLPAKAAGDSVWVVCVVVDAAFEEPLKDMLRLYDRGDYFDDQMNYALSEKYEDEADEIMEDMLTKGAVRFDGGRFFYQFKMDYSGGNTGEFAVPGIPADKDYFLYVLVFNQEITSIDDMQDAESDVYMEMKYYDPDYYTGGHPGISGVEKGWYYFNDWEYTETGGNPALLASTTIWEKSGVKISNQPFTVAPGDDTSLEVLLIENL